MGVREWGRRIDARRAENIRRRGVPAPLSRRNLALWWVGLVVLFAAKQLASDRLPDRIWWDYLIGVPFYAYIIAGYARLDSPTPWRMREWVRERVSGGRG